MNLKAPGVVLFTLSIVLVVVAAVSKYAQAHIPFINSNEFPVLILAHLLLVIGCIKRGV